MRYYCLITTCLGLLVILDSCGSSSLKPTPVPGQFSPPPTVAVSGIPFPKDGVQPWEKTDAAGHVAPPAHRQSSSALGPSSEFHPGIERFLEGGGVSDLGEATKLDSPTGGPAAYALYRFTLGGAEPGVVTVDANLHGAGASYFVAVADYQSERWHWTGPFTDAQVALPVSLVDATSAQGNAFVAIAAYGGSQLDIVGVGVTPVAAGDTTAPPAPATPVATPVAGGIELAWIPVVAADLAGYRVYYSNAPFIQATGFGVQALPYLEGTTRLILPAPAGRITYVALSAVDANGNESALSPKAFTQPLPGAPPAIQLTTSIISGGLNDPATITASGAASYDFDTDGDGDFDVTGDTTGLATVDTSLTGLIRPRVRGTASGGTAVAMGAVSLLITGNQRPVAVITSPGKTWGAQPLQVPLQGGTSTDFDGTIAEWAWDGQGDGIYDQVSTTDPDFQATYIGPEQYSVKLRVTDNDGAWDVDGAMVDAQEGRLEMFYEPSVQTGQHEEITVAYHGWEPVTEIAWDLYDNGTVDITLPPDTPLVFNAGTPEVFKVKATATLSTGAKAIGTAQITVHGWAINNVAGPPDGGSFVSGALFHDQPAVCYIDTSNTLKFMRSNNNPSNWTAPVAVAPAADTPWKCSMVTLADKSVGIAYTDSTDGDLLYVRALNAAGSSWSAPVLLESNGITTDNISAALINGRPAVAYYHSALKNPLYVQAADASGITWNAPVVIENLAADDGKRICLAQINGKPAVAFGADMTNIRYAQATDANGSAWQASVSIDNFLHNDNTQLCLAEIVGRPAVAAADNDGAAGRYRMVYYRASDPDGVAWLGNVAIVVKNDTGVYATAMAVVGNVPTITFNDGLTQYLATSNTVVGEGWTTEQIAVTGIGSQDTTSALFDYDFGRTYVAQSCLFTLSLTAAIKY